MRRSKYGTGKRANWNRRSKDTQSPCSLSHSTTAGSIWVRWLTHPVSCSSDLSVKIWDIAAGWKNVRTLHGHEHSVSCVRFLPGDRHLVSASRDRTLRVWETATGFCTRTLHGHDDWVRTVDVSEDGRSLVSGSNDHTLRLWDAQTGEARHELRGHEHVVECVAFAPTSAYANIRTLGGIRMPRDDPSASLPGQYIASGSRDKTIRVWSQQGQCLRVLVRFSPNPVWTR